MNKQATPVNYPYVLLQYLREEGYDTESLTKQIHLDETILTNPDASIPTEQYHQLIESALDLTKKADLGLHYGLALNIMSHGELGIAIMSSATFGEAIHTGLTYKNIRKPLLELSHTIHNDQFEVRIENDSKIDRIHRFTIDTTLANLQSLHQFLLGDQSQICHVFFDYDKPNDITTYQKIFGEKIYFNHPYCAISVAACALEIKLPLANPLIRKAAEEQCKNQLSEIQDHQDLVTKIKQHLLSRPGYFPSLNETANKLFMSPRTLRRKLNVLDTSYQKILDETRKSLALTYLKDQTLHLSDICELLGYNDTSNFTNAFKKWTGSTPSKYR